MNWKERSQLESIMTRAAHIEAGVDIGDYNSIGRLHQDVIVLLNLFGCGAEYRDTIHSVKIAHDLRIDVTK